MKIREVVGFDPDKKAVDTLKQNAKRMQQVAAAQARVEVKKAQQQLAKAQRPATLI